MTTDLLLNKEQLLVNWCKEKGYFSKAEVMDYGVKNFYIRADRTIRDLVTQEKVKHLTKDECLFRGLKGKMAWYEWSR